MRTEATIGGAAMAIGLAFAAPCAYACGFCVEDRVAAVYDHAVVEAATARHRAVAFFAVEGDLKPGAASQRALVAALEAGGGIRGSARVAVENAACSIAYDPARVSLADLTTRAGRVLGAKGLALAPLRVTDRHGELKEP
jgi:hypothetical protein